jgi:putative nucleotidyltransferase with HDIG domain
MDKRTKLYLGFIYILGSALLFFMFQEYTHLATQVSPIHILFFMGLAVVTESLQVGYRDTSISVGFAVTLASYTLFGPFVTAIIVSFGFLFRVTKKEEKRVHFFNTPWFKSLFNAMDMIISIFVASFVAQLIYPIPEFIYFSNTVDFIGLLVPGVIFSMVFSVINAILVAGLFSTMAPNSFRHYFKELFGLTFLSTVSIGMFLGLILAVLFKTMGIFGSLLFFLPILYARYTFKLYVDMKDAYLITIRALATSMDAKDHYTQGHSERVAQYAEIIARGMKLSFDEVENIKTAAMLHDIGKIGVPDNILNKPDRLSDEEYRICQRHAEIGHSIVTGISYLDDLKEIIRNHHERYDGKGYPDKIGGDQVALSTYIVALADAYDAMSSDRPYRNALPDNKILKIIEEERGKQFHPDVVDAFLALKKDGRL